MELLTKLERILMWLKEGLYKGIKDKDHHKKNRACNLVLTQNLMRSKTYQEYVKRNAITHKGTVSVENIR